MSIVKQTSTLGCIPTWPNYGKLGSLSDVWNFCAAQCTSDPNLTSNGRTVQPSKCHTLALRKALSPVDVNNRNRRQRLHEIE